MSETKPKNEREAADLLYDNLKDLVHCIRDFQLGDYSPLMDEIFDSEHALKQYERLKIDRVTHEAARFGEQFECDNQE
jgi:hypothetical protein